MSGSSVIEQQRFTCAIGGMQSVVAIPRALPILHSGPGCGTMVAGFFERSTGYAGGCTTPCTNFSESEVVFGGENKLETLIRNSYRILDTDLQVVLTGCTSAIVGDDVEQIVRTFADEGKPIVYVETAGFKSNNYVSHSHIVNAVIDQYVNRYVEDSGQKDPRLVNVFASIPWQDPFWKGNLSEIKRLLQGIGLKVNILFGPESSGVEEWKTIPQAAMNVLISPWYGEEIVQHLKGLYDQPWFQYPCLPIGGNETTRFLRELVKAAEAQGLEISKEQAEQFIQKEERAFYEEIDNLATFLLEFRYGLPRFFHVFHDAGYVLGMCRFLLHEVGIVPREQFITDKTPPEYQEHLLQLFDQISPKKEIPVFFLPDAGLAQEKVRESQHEGRGLIIGSGWDRDLAREKDYDFLSAAVPSSYRLVLTTGYAGYRGGLHLIEDIYHRALDRYR